MQNHPLVFRPVPLQGRSHCSRFENRRPACVGLAFLALILAATSSTPAATITWTNVNGGSWSAATGWSPNQVPGASDDVYFNVSGTYTIAVDMSPTVNSLTLGAPTGQQTLSVNGVTLTVNNTSLIQSNGVLVQSGGAVVTGAGMLTVNGMINWSGGSLSLPITVATNGTLLLSGPNDFNWPSYILTNFGTVTWSGTGNLRGGGASGTQIYNFGLWDAQTDQEINGAYGNQVVFNNLGTFRKSAGTGGSATTMQGNVFFDNAGLVDVRAGNLTLNNNGSGSGTFAAGAGDAVTFNQGYTFTGGSLLSGAGSFNLAAGPFTLPTTLGSTNVQMTGGSLTGPNVLIGQLAWYGGTWNGAGPITVASNSLLVLAGSGDHDIPSCVLSNFGIVTWSGGCNVRGGASGTQILNYGLWNAQTDNEFDNAYGGQPTVFNNFGTFRKSAGAAGSATTMQNNVLFNNAGLVDVRAGNLTLNFGGSGAGTFTGGVTSTVTFNQGYTFTGGSLLSGAGVFNLVGGTFNLPTTINSTNVQMIGGSLTGTNILNGQLAWYGGLWNSAGPITIASNSLLVLAGTADHDLAGTVLTNFGTVTWSGACNVRGGGTYGTQIYNYGLWDAQTDWEINNAYGGQPTVFNNYGTFQKSAGAAGSATTMQNNVLFNNSGRVDVLSGNLTLNFGGTGGGTFNAAAGNTVTFSQGYAFTTGSLLSGAGVFNLAGGPFNLPTTIASTNVAMIGGSLIGSNVLNGKLTWYNGTWNNSGPVIIASNSLLILAGTADHNLASCIVSNFGVVDWAGACNLRAGGSGTSIYNFGLWDAQSDQEINNAYGGPPTVFNNFGRLRKSAGTGATVLQNNVGLFNYGTLDVQTARVQLNGSYAFYNSGTLNFGINSATNFGTLQLAGAASLAGRLSANFNNTSGPYLYPSLAGHSFALISYSGESGLFGQTNLPPANSWWRVSYGSGALTIVATASLPGQGGAVVQALSLWSDTSLRVTNGWRVLITAEGSWSWAANQTFGPDGDANTTTTADLFYSGARHAALIGYVGADPFQGHWLDGSFFPQATGYWNIGSSNLFTADHTGELWLGFNDDAVSGGTNDNSGFVSAQISIMPPELVIQMVTRQHNTLMFAWATIPGQTYQVQYKTDLTQLAWNNLAAAFVAADTSAMAFDSVGPDPQRFYRVVQLP